MTTTSTTLPRLEDYVAFARRYLALLCIGMLTGAGAGMVVLLQQQPVDTASASVLLTPLPSHADIGPDGSAPEAVTIDTDAHVVTSAHVVSAVAEATDLPAEKVRSALMVSAEPLTQVLRVSFSAADSRRAARGAQVAAQRLLVARGQALDNAGGQVAALRDSLGALRLEIRDSEIGAMRTVLRVQLAQRRDFLTEVLAASADTGQVVNRATTPRRSRVVNPEVPLASGAMLGLLAAVVLGAVRDRTRRPLRAEQRALTQQARHQHAEPGGGVDPG